MNEKAIETEKTDFAEVMPLVDILEEENNVTMWFEVPGANSDTVKIEVRNRVMTMSAESTLRHDGRPIVFKREFQLSDVIAIEGISAATKDGVLTLTLPKSERAKVHRIKVG